MDQPEELPKTLIASLGDLPIHAVYALRLIRPHPGIWISPRQASSEIPTLEEMRGFDSSGIDILLIICRHLTSFGYSVDVPDDSPESLVCRAMNRDMGWNEEADLKMKEALYRDLTNSAPPFKPFRFASLIHNDALLDLFVNNKRFHLISRLCGQKEGNEITKTRRIGDPLYTELNDLSFDDSKSMTSHLMGLFDVAEPCPFYPTASAAKFLNISYIVKIGGTDISNLRVLKLRLPFLSPVEHTERRECVIHTVVYILCAVVNVTPSQRERVRLYHKTGWEALPAQVGDLSVKSNDMNTNWSIKEQGEYTLFYYRLDIGTRDHSTCKIELDIHAPEFGDVSDSQRSHEV